MPPIFFQRAKARQYSPVIRIWSSNMWPTNLETEVLSSAAFWRAHRAASLTVMVMVFTLRSVYQQLRHALKMPVTRNQAQVMFQRQRSDPEVVVGTGVPASLS